MMMGIFGNNNNNRSTMMETVENDDINNNNACGRISAMSSTSISSSKRTSGASCRNVVIEAAAAATLLRPSSSASSPPPRQMMMFMGRIRKRSVGGGGMSSQEEEQEDTANHVIHHNETASSHGKGLDSDGCCCGDDDDDNDDDDDDNCHHWGDNDEMIYANSIILSGSSRSQSFGGTKRSKPSNSTGGLYSIPFESSLRRITSRLLRSSQHQDENRPGTVLSAAAVPSHHRICFGDRSSLFAKARDHVRAGATKEQEDEHEDNKDVAAAVVVVESLPPGSSRFFATPCSNNNNPSGNNNTHFRSSEFMSNVQEVSLIDNAGHHGIYSGTLDSRTDRPNGHGTMIYSEDDLIYDGQWVDGDWCGFGTLIDTGLQHVYQGGFFDNYKHGLGVLQYSDGRIYDGTFALGKLEGKGHLEYPNGTKYWGYWTDDGIEHGRGKKIFEDGRVYDGEFDRGVLHGHGRMTYPDGSWYLGEWMDGERYGLGMEVGPDGILVCEGTFCNGRPIEGSSCPNTSSKKSEGDFLLYRSSIAPHGTLVGSIPKEVCMRDHKFQKWVR